MATCAAEQKEQSTLPTARTSLRLSSECNRKSRGEPAAEWQAADPQGAAETQTTQAGAFPWAQPETPLSVGSRQTPASQGGSGVPEVGAGSGTPGGEQGLLRGVGCVQSYGTLPSKGDLSSAVVTWTLNGCELRF